jgi:hypothetical protein
VVGLVKKYYKIMINRYSLYNHIGSLKRIDSYDHEYLLRVDGVCYWFNSSDLQQVSEKVYKKYKNKVYYQNKKNKVEVMKLAQPLGNLHLK